MTFKDGKVEPLEASPEDITIIVMYGNITLR